MIHTDTHAGIESLSALRIEGKSYSGPIGRRRQRYLGSVSDFSNVIFSSVQMIAQKVGAGPELLRTGLFASRAGLLIVAVFALLMEFVLWLVVRHQTDQPKRDRGAH